MSSQDTSRDREPSENAQTAADRDTIGAYLKGQSQAFDLVDRWVRTELGVRFPVLRPELEDLCQTVHGQLLLTFRRGTFRHQSSLKTFVARIARYVATDHIRKAYRDPLWESVLESQLAITRESPFRSFDLLEKRELLRHILLLSSGECRELWRLAFVEQLAYDEIGRRLSIAPGTVKSRMWRCRRKVLTLMRRLRVRGSNVDH